MSWKDELVQNIKDCGQSLIDNAEKIACYEYNTDLRITCYPARQDGYPSVVVETEFVPEKTYERYM